MTCIVAVSDGQRVVMGADSMSHNGSTATTLLRGKVFKRNDVLFGTCGTGRFGQLLRYDLHVPDPPARASSVEQWAVQELVPELRGLCQAAGHLEKEEKDLWAMPGNVLVATRGRIVRVYGNFEATEASVPYDAEGSGCEAALGALHAIVNSKPHRTLEQYYILALEAAAYHTPHVREPFHFVRLP